ncbi:hypothetical protein Lalb_Chr07g0188751 [Lupinus albus]|uniref:Uncharacterized protein n=1 Tax=Lupinus albus TaxID=3870 RepID=A0A6A4QA11_LUPAL|nr:hypothetical protein Lalb_Chr07g0188751 [Lupinus albus]
MLLYFVFSTRSCKEVSISGYGVLALDYPRFGLSDSIHGYGKFTVLVHIFSFLLKWCNFYTLGYGIACSPIFPFFSSIIFLLFCF